MRTRPAALASLAVLLAMTLAGTATAGEPAIIYPAKVYTLPGRIFELASLGHDLGDGSFTFYDQNEEGRVAWRDLDKVEFIQNVGHVPGAEGKKVPHTERVRLFYLDGSDRVVDLVVGRIHGDDGVAEKSIFPRDISLIDFDQARIAPQVYKVCERGHQWEQPDYRFCPYDGRPLHEISVGR